MKTSGKDQTRHGSGSGPRPASAETGRHEAGHGGKVPSLHEDTHARIVRPHKGDVGRPGSNEEVFQGSKQKELAG